MAQNITNDVRKIRLKGRDVLVLPGEQIEIDKMIEEKGIWKVYQRKNIKHTKKCRAAIVGMSEPVTKEDDSQ